MGKQRRIALAALSVVVLGELVWAVIPSGPPDPVYEGKPVSFWVRHPEIEIWPEYDSNAVPILVKMLETRDGLPQQAYASVYYKITFWLRDHLPEPVAAALVRLGAAATLGPMGSQAKPAIPALIRASREDEDIDVRKEAVSSLGMIGWDEQNATAGVADALKDQNPQVRDVACIALMNIHSSAAAAEAGVK